MKQENREMKAVIPKDNKRAILSSIDSLKRKIDIRIKDIEHDIGDIRYKKSMCQKLDLEFELMNLRYKEKNLLESKWILEEILKELNSDIFKN